MNCVFKGILIGGAALGLGLSVSAQQLVNWQHKDLTKDGLFGISTEKAYGLLRGKKAVPVTVAVIDSGIDVTDDDRPASAVYRACGRRRYLVHVPLQA